jgi:hypothetical protein
MKRKLGRGCGAHMGVVLPLGPALLGETAAGDASGRHSIRGNRALCLPRRLGFFKTRGLIKGNRVDLDGLPVRFGSRWIYDDS